MTDGEIFSVVYHNIFDFPLNFSELIRWKAGNLVHANRSDLIIVQKNGYFFVEGKEGLVYKRLLRKRVSVKKREFVAKVARFLKLIPTIRMVAVTGSLAMDNADEESDIDLMVVTQEGFLWTSRLLVYLLVGLFRIPFRRAGKREERNKLCLNMWLDESDLVWPRSNRNIYTAHEIMQVVPVFDKGGTHQNFISRNKWAFGYWPNAINKPKQRYRGLQGSLKKYSMFSYPFYLACAFIEKMAFFVQHTYMKSKITREIVTPTRAIFHPNDWSSVVLGRLST